MAEWLPVLVPAVGRALLEFVWQGALVGAAVALLLRLLRDARPQARYAVACLGLLACVLVPVAGVLAALGEGSFLQVATPVRIAADAPAAAAAAPARWAGLDDALPLVVSLWAAGASACFLRLACGVAWIRRLRRAGRIDPAWQARLDALAQRVGLRRAVALRLADGLASPVAAGWWRPIVLLPAALAARMPVDLLEALVAHELAHIRRHDYLVNLLQGVVEALLFYHPVVWWLSRRIRIEREHVADALAADALGDRRRLAVALAALADAVPASHFAPHLAPAAHGGLLMSRIARLVRPERRTTTGRLAFPLLGLAAAGIAFIAQAQIGETPPRPIADATAAPAAVAHPPAANATVAPLPAPAAAAAKAPGVLAQVARAKRRDDAYAIVQAGSDSMTMSGSIDDIDDIHGVQRVVDRDFIWFRREGKAYVITDPATVARARAAWRDSERLGARMEALERKMKPHEEKMEALGERMEQLSEQHGESAAMERAGREMEALGRRQEALAGQQLAAASAMAAARDDAERDRHSARMEELGRQMEALGKQMERHGDVLAAEGEKLERMQAPMEALGREMEAAGKPMEALGREMEALGREQEEHARQAERQLQALLREAQAKGLVQPAPAVGPAQ